MILFLFDCSHWLRYDIVMMAIVKMKKALREILRGFCYGDDVYANETEKTVLISGLS